MSSVRFAPFVAPITPSDLRGATRCRVCCATIETDDPRFVHSGISVHLDCAKVFWAPALPLRKITVANMYDAATRAQLKLRLEAIQFQQSQRFLARDSTAQSDASRFDAIEPLHDRTGRPYVRLYVDGRARLSSAQLVPAQSSRGFWEAPVTEKRVYVVHRIEPGAPREEDPAIATVGALFIVHAERALGVERTAALLAFRAQRLPTPVLWIIGADVNARAIAEQRARKLLVQCGFAGDEACCVQSDDGESAAFETVLAALDATLIEALRPPLLVDRDASEQQRNSTETVALFDACVTDRDTLGARALLRRVTRDWREVSAPAMQAFAARAVREIADDELRPAIVDLCALVNISPDVLRREDAEPLCDWVSAQLDTARTFSRETETALRVLVTLSCHAVIERAVRRFARATNEAVLARIAESIELSATSASFIAATNRALATALRELDSDDVRAVAAKRLQRRLRARAKLPSMKQ